MKLTPAHIKALDAHLRQNIGLKKEDFILEITDHYACALETCSPGQPWHELLDSLDTKFGGREGLQNMEKDYFEKARERFHEAYITTPFRTYLSTPPKCYYTLAFVLLFSIWYVLDPQQAYWLSVALWAVFCCLHFLALGIGCYYWLVSRDTQQAFIFRQVFLPFGLGQIYLVKLFHEADPLFGILLILLTTFSFLINLVNIPAFIANYRHLQVKLRIRA